MKSWINQPIIIKKQKNINTKKFFESHSESDHDSDYESDYESENELEKITHNIINDIKTDVNEFCVLIPRVYIIPKLRDFKNVQNEKQSTLEKYNNNIEKGIDHILSHIHNIIKYKTKEIRIKMINKYIKNPRIQKNHFQKYSNFKRIIKI